MRASPPKILIFALALVVGLTGAGPSLKAQTASSVLGSAISDPMSQEVLRALQQRGGGQTIDSGVQPSIQMQTPSLYPQTLPAVPRNPFGVATTAGLSALEKLMSLRVGQRLEQFGYETFGHGAPVVVRQSGGLQDNYVLGEGDEIVVTLHGQENANYRTRVDRDGRVVLPSLRAIPAAGRNFGAFRADLEAAVSRAFVGTEASVSVGTVRQVGVRVVGEVNAPGLYNLSGLSTALDALNLANGVKKTGSLRNIQIVRGGRTMRLDLYALLTNQASASDITLTDGDRIVVPLLTGAVAVAGQARRPGIYELPFGAAAARTNDLLALAGGPQVRGAYRFSVMTTGEDGRRTMQPVGPDANVLVHDGDAVFVTQSGDVSVARIELMGSTPSHGYFALDDAPTLHGLFKSADMFAAQPGQPLPYLLMAAIIRLDRQTMQRSVIPFSPADILGGKNDQPLQSNDVVYILNVAEMRYIARRAAQLAMREAERNGAAISSEGIRNQALTSAAAGIGQLGTASAFQNGALGGVTATAAGANPQSQGYSQNTPRSDYAQTGDTSSDSYARYGLSPLRPVRGPYGTPDNDDLPELGGIPAPPDIMTTEDELRMNDNGPDRYSRDANDADMRGGREPSGDGINRGVDMRSGRDERSLTTAGNQVLRPVLRLFIGLDDDQRQLLINTLRHYYVLIGGEVNNPGAFLAMPDTGLDRIVQAAAGLTPNVDLSGFEVSSAEVDSRAGVSRTVRKTYTLAAGQFSQVALRPLDQVRFNRIFSDHAGEMTISGEVRYPGSYAITRTERLSSVLRRAGGLIESAYPYGAIFLRRSVAEQERGVLQREADALDGQLIALMSSVSANKTQISDSEIQYVNQMMLRLRQASGQGGRVAVEIDPRAIAAHPELDVALEPGDQLFVPRTPNSVVVAGEVMSPSGIQFKEGRSVADYLALAGGVTEIADDDHVFVIQPDGSAVQAQGSSWLGDPPKLAPGSVIVVPRTLHPFTWDVVLQNVIQMTSQLAITAASISVIGR